MENKKLNKNITIFKIILILLVTIIIAFVTIKLMPIMKDISTQEGQQNFRNQINLMGIKGLFMMLGLQICQILLVVFPGEPLEVIAGMCYGPIYGTLFIFCSVLLTTIVIYCLVKKYKENYLLNFFKKGKIQKITNSSWYKDKKKTENILLFLFLIPGTPKDLLTYMGPLLNISPIKFIILATFARFPSVISSTLVGSNILDGNVKSAVLVYLLTTIVTVIFILIVKLFDKDNNTKDAINSVK